MKKRISNQSIDPNLGLFQEVKLRSEQGETHSQLKSPISGRPSRLPPSPPPPRPRRAAPGRALAAQGRAWPRLLPRAWPPASAARLAARLRCARPRLAAAATCCRRPTRERERERREKGE